MDTLTDGSTRIPVNRGEFPDGAKRGNRARRHHVGGQNGVSASWCARRKRNERKRKTQRDVFRAAEGGKASNARRRAAKLARGSRLCDKEERGKNEKRMRGREGGGGSTPLSSYTRLNNIPISISEKWANEMLIAGSCVWRIIIIARRHFTRRTLDLPSWFTCGTVRCTPKCAAKNDIKESSLIFQVLIMICIIFCRISGCLLSGKNMENLAFWRISFVPGKWENSYGISLGVAHGKVFKKFW